MLLTYHIHMRTYHSVFLQDYQYQCMCGWFQLCWWYSSLLQSQPWWQPAALLYTNMTTGSCLLQIKISRCLSSWSSVCWPIGPYGPWVLPLWSSCMSTVLGLLGLPISQVPWVPDPQVLLDSYSSHSHPVLWFSGLGSLHPRFPCLVSQISLQEKKRGKPGEYSTFSPNQPIRL